VDSDGEEFDEFEEEVDSTSEDGEPINCVVRPLLSVSHIKTPARHRIFRTKCKVNGAVCNLIVDGGSSENIISSQMVETLNLTTQPHPEPYTIGWL
ncbi:retropepsin-like aspartic protease, partial [Salmonella enterica subsp. enterica serovar 1,4,[5],12:i:-]|nr:retropepsin-like aspartic protease [Salmonella enterica subsp. enterica serovar 1,4,[5],12:i:-]